MAEGSNPSCGFKVKGGNMFNRKKTYRIEGHIREESTLSNYYHHVLALYVKATNPKEAVDKAKIEIKKFEERYWKNMVLWIFEQP